MNYENLIKVELEAKRFLGLVEDAKKAILKDSGVTIVGSKETAACRRASMDLTRALGVFLGWWVENYFIDPQGPLGL